MFSRCAIHLSTAVGSVSPKLDNSHQNNLNGQTALQVRGKIMKDELTKLNDGSCNLLLNCY